MPPIHPGLCTKSTQKANLIQSKVTYEYTQKSRDQIS